MVGGGERRREKDRVPSKCPKKWWPSGLGSSSQVPLDLSLSIWHLPVAHSGTGLQHVWAEPWLARLCQSPCPDGCGALQVPAWSPPRDLGALWKWGGFCGCNCPAAPSTSGQLRFNLGKSRVHPAGGEGWAPVTEPRPAAGGRGEQGAMLPERWQEQPPAPAQTQSFPLQKRAGFCVSAQPRSAGPQI